VPASLRERGPELLILLVGVLLRSSMRWSYPPEAGYDFASHWTYVTWVAREGTLPVLDPHSLAASHPPLFDLLAAAIVRGGGGPAAVQLISVSAGALRLALVWLGLEIMLPGATVARRVALALAAVLPISVQLDGTVSGESLLATIVAAALLLVPAAFGEGRRATAMGALLGALLGLAFLTKVSALTVLGALGAVAVTRLVIDRAPWRDRVRRLAPLLAAMVTFVATTGWYVARNQTMYGKPLVTTFDAPGLPYMPATHAMPLWFRRSPGFYLGWSRDIYTSPYYPSASLADARFFPQLVASTFVDYYNHSFAPARPGAPAVIVNDRPLPVTALALGRASMIAGTLIVLVTAIAWAVALARASSTRAWAEIALFVVPLAAVAGLAHYVLVYPHDWLGVVKGAYVLYGAPPLFALFGVGVAWLAHRARPLALLPLVALGVVAAYTIWCRTA
jgi:hypothetical protein